MSGSIPYLSEPHNSPVRPKPQITSSAMSGMPYLFNTGWIAWKYPSGRRNDAPCAQHGLGEEARDVIGPGVADCLLQLPRQPAGEIRLRSPGAASRQWCGEVRWRTSYIGRPEADFT